MLAILCALPILAAPQTQWFVDVSGTAPGSGTVVDPYTSIEFAIAQAATLPGDTILVAPGTYTGETIDFLGKELSIEASAGAGTVTVQGPYTSATDSHAPGSGGQALIRVVSGEGSGTRIEGIDFTFGAGEDMGTESAGGVLYMVGSELELVDCVLDGYAHTLGGAVYCESSVLEVSGGSITGTVTHPSGTSSGGAGEFDARGGAIHASGSILRISGAPISGSAQFNSAGYSTSVYASQMDLIDGSTTVIGADMSGYSPCEFDCFTASSIRVDRGSLSMDSCTWPQSNANHYIEAEQARISLVGMDWYRAGGTRSAGRVLYATDCQTLIRGCTFDYSLGSVADRQPIEFLAGGQIRHSGGLLQVEDCHFSRCGHMQGGALFASNLILRNSHFENNVARAGWVMYESRGSAVSAEVATIEDCTFEGNTTTGAGGLIQIPPFGSAQGGVIYLSGPSTVRRCYFYGNRTSGSDDIHQGGVIYAESPIRIQDCEFTSNRIDHRSDQVSEGGALYLEQGGVIERCVFQGNRIVNSSQWGVSQTLHGGAIYSTSGELLIRDSMFARNEAEVGGAVYLAPSATGAALHTLFHGNLLAANASSSEQPNAAVWKGAMHATQCTIIGHEVEHLAAQVYDQGALDSCIVWGNVPQAIPAGVTATHSTIQGGAGGLGNSSEDPLFWQTRDFQLLPGSPAIDAGNPGLMDADGTRADRGAHPYDPGYCSAWCAAVLGTHPCQSNANSLGVPAAIGAWGSMYAIDGFMILSATSVPENSVGYFMASESAGFIPLFGGGQGDLCLGGPLYRMNDELLTANAGHRVGRRVQLTSLSQG
ncbi:MAG: right-handed parallel beta-helix repeat-containing protein, partial [Planctomycetota bacterium]|nr:right-handed parallel beta-helix repeat-containing protein [Planctomycetota bacterium]